MKTGSAAWTDSQKYIHKDLIHDDARALKQEIITHVKEKKRYLAVKSLMTNNCIFLSFT